MRHVTVHVVLLTAGRYDPGGDGGITNATRSYLRRLGWRSKGFGRCLRIDHALHGRIRRSFESLGEFIRGVGLDVEVDSSSSLHPLSNEHTADQDLQAVTTVQGVLGRYGLVHDEDGRQEKIVLLAVSRGIASGLLREFTQVERKFGYGEMAVLTFEWSESLYKLVGAVWLGDLSLKGRGKKWPLVLKGYSCLPEYKEPIVPAGAPSEGQ